MASVTGCGLAGWMRQETVRGMRSRTPAAFHRPDAENEEARRCLSRNGDWAKGSVH
jgi:hypothetical protein